MSAVKPFIEPDGTLVIPSRCAKKYHWWAADGMSILDILAELGASFEQVSSHMSIGGWSMSPEAWAERVANVA